MRGVAVQSGPFEELALADPLDQGLRLDRGAAVEPDHGVAQRAQPAVDGNDPVDLAGHAQLSHLTSGDAGPLEHLADDRCQPPLPLGRILLGPAACGVPHRTALPPHGENLAVGVEKAALDALRTDVYADGVAHL